MECRFLSEKEKEWKEQLGNFCELSAGEKIEVLYALLGSKTWKFLLWLKCKYESVRKKENPKWRNWKKIILHSPKKLEEKYALIRFCLKQCEEWEREIIKLEMNKAQVGAQYSNQFTSTYYPLAMSIMGVVFSIAAILADAEGEAFFTSKMWIYLLAGFGAISMLSMFYIIYMRLMNEPAAKRATYICGMIDMMQNTSEKDNALPDGNTYIVTVKKES